MNLSLTQTAWRFVLGPLARPCLQCGRPSGYRRRVRRYCGNLGTDSGTKAPLSTQGCDDGVACIPQKGADSSQAPAGPASKRGGASNI